MKKAIFSTEISILKTTFQRLLRRKAHANLTKILLKTHQFSVFHQIMKMIYFFIVFSQEMPIRDRSEFSLEDRVAKMIAMDPYFQARIDELINGMSSFSFLMDKSTDHSFHLHM